MSEEAAGLPDNDEQVHHHRSEAKSADEEEIQWVQVATAVGTPNATIIAGRLQSQEIPAKVTQEAAGVNVFAVTVGLLGTAHVWVPEEYRELAETILAADAEEEE